MMKEDDKAKFDKFADLTYEDFRRMAMDGNLSCFEKIGFPNAYREGKEQAIFSDIVRKVNRINEREKTVLDIGPGCSELPQKLISLCEKNGHRLILIDSEEMLANLPDAPFIEKIPAYYPDCANLFSNYAGKIDVIINYSVLHYVFVEANMWAFIDRSLSLLSEGGQMLIGDIPNVSKRKRFFASQAGIRFHQEFTDTKSIPSVSFNTIELDRIDDSVMLSIIMRVRNAGFDGYLLPQGEDLPMANRREDILIVRP